MRRNSLGLLLAAAAAYGAYRYRKMTPAQRDNLMAKGKDLFNKNLGGLTNLFGKKKTTVNGSGY